MPPQTPNKKARNIIENFLDDLHRCNFEGRGCVYEDFFENGQKYLRCRLLNDDINNFAKEIEEMGRGVTQTDKTLVTTPDDEVDLCTGCNTMKHLKDGLCGRCRTSAQNARVVDKGSGQFATTLSTSDELRQKIAKLLRGDMAVTRDWTAWQYNTMTQDDFLPLEETERVDEILELFTDYHQSQLEKAVVGAEIKGKLMALDKLVMGAGEYHDDPYEYTVPLRHIQEYRQQLSQFDLSQPIFRDNDLQHQLEGGK